MVGFEPVFDRNSKVLILGSFPSVISRKVEFYYGNKQNKFWKLINQYFNQTLNTIQEKKEFLINHQIAIWDIVKSCDIDGSLDSNLKNIEFVQLERILPPNTKICFIYCNGKKSYELTTKYLKLKDIKIPVFYLPSTSPANVNFKLEEWEEFFKKIEKIQWVFGLWICNNLFLFLINFEAM